MSTIEIVLNVKIDELVVDESAHFVVRTKHVLVRVVQFESTVEFLANFHKKKNNNNFNF